MESSLIDCLKSTMNDVCTRMMQASVENLNGGYQRQPEPGDLSSVITIMRGNILIGFIALHMSPATGAVLSNRLLSSEGERSEREIASTVNEMLNIVAGRCYSMLREQYPGIICSLPAITPGGTGPLADTVSRVEINTMAFKLDNNEFSLEVGLGRESVEPASA
ncbi:chemotaxis protein CheX [Planctomycetota bacterium]